MTQIKIIDAASGQIYSCPHETTMEQMRAFFHPQPKSNPFKDMHDEMIKKQQEALQKARKAQSFKGWWS